MRWLFLNLCLLSSIWGSQTIALFSSLDPLSVSEHFAFYELYPETPEGKQALARAWQLLNQSHVELKKELTLPPLDIQALISLITRQPFDPPVTLSEEQLQTIETIGSHLKNRQLKGHAL